MAEKKQWHETLHDQFGQYFAFFSDGNANAAEIAVAVFTEGFHVEGVVITEIPLVLLGEKDQCATNLPVR